MTKVVKLGNGEEAMVLNYEEVKLNYLYISWAIENRALIFCLRLSSAVNCCTP